MKVIIDAFGGDHAPASVLEGCALAINEFDLDIICVGDEEKVRKEAAERHISLEKMEVVHATSVISCNDPPTKIRSTHANSSMAVGLQLLKDGAGDIFISAGSTGALVVGAVLIVGRLEGVKHPAIATFLPSKSNCFLLLDSGATIDCKAETLEQFAVMSTKLMPHLKAPRIGLLNIGVESIKGTGLQRRAFELLAGNSTINFVGNIEPGAAFAGMCDVLVADGFNGNIFLKTIEAASAFVVGELEGAGLTNELAVVARAFDSSRAGGSLLVGLNKLVLKAHGSANAQTIKGAIGQALKVVKGQGLHAGSGNGDRV
ncbi:MAG: phosphate acyltransferase PlsX [Oscillospiraceae bacterium]|jgi:glycerol-3-phosphate acyltransferase PlsX|nr:phosphate acyltransferase PlsX [Oscillospiraceae bacterium]